MDRSAAWALFCIAVLLAGLAAYAWTLDPPLDPYRTLVLEPGGERFLGPEAARLDTGILMRESAIQGLRRAPLLVAAFATAFGLFLLLRTAPSVTRPTLEQVFVTLAPLIAGSTIGAAVFTPPDVLSMLLLLAFQWVTILPVATVILFTVRAVRQRP